MNNRMLLAALAGGLAHFVLGYLFYMVLFVDFFKANAGSASGYNREEPIMWAIALGSLVTGLLYAWIFDRWGSISTFRGGATAGAMIGFLMWLGINLIMYGATNAMTLNGALVDVVISAIMGALIGGVVGSTLGSRVALRAQRA
jgi:hypothetical protein